MIYVYRYVYTYMCVCVSTHNYYLAGNELNEMVCIISFHII